MRRSDGRTDSGKAARPQSRTRRRRSPIRRSETAESPAHQTCGRTRLIGHSVKQMRSGIFSTAACVFKYQFMAMSFRRKSPLRPLARGSILCHAFALSGVLILTCIQSALADALTVACTNDANGLYSYTFSKGAAPYVWGLTTNGLGLSLQSYGVIQTIQPPNWAASVDPSGLIVWTVTNGIVYLDEPVTFSVRSTFAVPRVYDS